MNYSEIIKQVRRSEKQKLAVVCYAKHNGKILLLKRKYEPFAGFLVPPGGKVETWEEIEEAMHREFLEETGLKLQNLELKMITSELGPEKYNWILFIFTGETSTNSTIECDEGELVWINENEMSENNLSPIDMALVPYIFAPGIKIAYIDYSLNKEIKRLEINEINKLDK